MMAKGETILVAEDERYVLSATCTLLETLGYKILSAKNGEDAVQLFKEAGDSIDMLLFDLVMPKLCGSAAALQIRALNPDIPILFFTGYGDYKMRVDIDALGDFDLIYKPVRIAPLGRKIRSILD